ncbi:MAG: gliding motility protein GldL [Bacteroidota bacterium]
MENTSTSHNSWITGLYKHIMPKVYGIGAAVVISGAMFKLLNWPGGSLMLGLGLTTEAIIFFLSAFEPQGVELDWTRVYPALSEKSVAAAPIAVPTQHPLTEKLDQVLQHAKIDSELVDRLGQGMQRLTEATEQIATLQHAAKATEKYVGNIEKASATLEHLQAAHTGTLDAVNKLAEISVDVQSYHEQMQQLTATLDTLNATYQDELAEARLRSTSNKNLYDNITDSMGQLQEASEESNRFKTELTDLSSKISSLNSVYGNMLTALKN